MQFEIVMCINFFHVFIHTIYKYTTWFQSNLAELTMILQHVYGRDS